MKRPHRLAVLAILMLSLIPAATAQAAPRCFPGVQGIAHCIDGKFLAFWERQGGLAVFGYPLGPEEQLRTGGATVTAQRFERVRLELHPEQPPPYDVLLSRAGVEALQRQGRDWTTFPTARPGAPHYFPETRHAIAQEFWDYWSTHGLTLDQQPQVSRAESLALFGLPLSEAAVETNGSGDRVLTQWFERARFEYHPQNPAGARVLLGLLGRELETRQETAVARPGPVGGAGGFVRAQGDQLVLNGQSIQLKGINYYPQTRPWGEMWDQWDGLQVERELRQARDELGINAVRVLVPYRIVGTSLREGNVDPNMIRRMRQISHIAGDLELKLVVALFDFYEDFAPAGTPEAERDIRYLRTVVGNFLGDDRIIAWDLHNEPDHYDLWSERSGGPQTLDWLGRMADELHRIDPNHLVTVGMGQYDNLYARGPDGRTTLDYTDVISIHSYNAGDVARQISEVRARTTKPILLGEFGWPTGPACVVREYTEAQQATVYKTTLQAVTGRVVGVFAWTLRDFDPGPTRRWDTREEHYGLYRPDGSLKPAAESFKAYGASHVPSALETTEPITFDGINYPGGQMGPIPVEGSSYYVKGWFRRAWDEFGGQASFGRPLGEAYERPGDRRIVQYFENTVLELYLEPTFQADFALLGEKEKVALVVRPVPLGLAFARGSVLPDTRPVADRFTSFYRQFNGRWRLGTPISPEMQIDVNGKPTIVQYYEKGRLQWNEAAGWSESSQVGRWAFEGQCAAVASGR